MAVQAVLRKWAGSRRRDDHRSGIRARRNASGDPCADLEVRSEARVSFGASKHTSKSDLRSVPPRPSEDLLMPLIRTCPSCAKPNRVPAEPLSDTGRCGSCKNPLPPMADPIEVGTAEFDEIVAASKVPVLVDFWA